MDTPRQDPGSHLSEPVRTPESPLEYEWLTVDQAVAFCSDRGLSRTPKTLRKWAERSYNKEDADIIVRRADTMWGYRWKIERTSLARKVDEELSLSNANPSEPVRTGAHVTAAPEENVVRKIKVNPSEPVRTSADKFAQPSDETASQIEDEPGSHPSEPVRTRLPVQSISQVEQELRDRLKDKDAENAFLRKQLELAQAEVGKRANSTDEALKTIDRVVRSFEMQAEANKALALGGATTDTASQDETEPIRFAPEATVTSTEESQARDDSVAGYQQPQSTWDKV